MPVPQLKYHLLREMLHMVDLSKNDHAAFKRLLLSGKGPVSAFRGLIALQNVVIDTFYAGNHVCRMVFHWGNSYCCIVSKCLQKLLLRWARFLVIPSIVSVESGITLVEIVNGCPNISYLNCVASEFASLLTATTADISTLREGVLSDRNEIWQSPGILLYLTTHPERCPIIEAISIRTSYDFAVFLNSLSNCFIPSVKSMDITVKYQCCTLVNFSPLLELCNSFPNIEEVSLCMEPDCDHENVDGSLMAYKQLYESFKKFNPPFNFEFNYFPDRMYDNYNKDLYILLSSNGKIHMTTDEDQGYRSYTATTSYPKKTMTIGICEFYSQDSLNDPMA